MFLANRLVLPNTVANVIKKGGHLFFFKAMSANLLFKFDYPLIKILVEPKNTIYIQLLHRNEKALCVMYVVLN